MTGEGPIDRDEFGALLERAASGDPGTASELVPRLYDELRRMARAQLRRVPPGDTLRATVLVHEAYLRLVGGGDPDFAGRAHFFGAAARAMRRIVVEHARRKLARKRGGDLTRQEFDEVAIELGAPIEDLLALDEALDQLEHTHPRCAKTVMLRYFGGLTEVEAADALGVDERTVRRHWAQAKLFLARAIGEEPA